jgi:phytoene dehydrogenase-like protein
MRSLPSVSAGSHLRARRWDAVVVGTALPGLVAAVRLCMHGARVLVLEEEQAAGAFPGLREPFHLTGAGGSSVLGTCLQALGSALIDRRRFDPDPVAYQVVLPEARVDVGESKLLAGELVAWGLAEPDAARSLLRALAECSAAEREAMLGAPLVPGRRLPRAALRPSAGVPPPPAPPPRHARGLPAEVRGATGRLGAFLRAQMRALSNLGGSEPSPEAAARLLGLALEGGARCRSADAGLRGLLRRRIETLYGEFRPLAGRFRLVSASKQPAIEPEDAKELWLGRALVLNAPHAALAGCLDQEPTPSFLQETAATHRRLSLHLRAAREVVPEGMAQRLVWVGDPERPIEGTNLVCVQRWLPGRERDRVDLVASAVVAADEPDLEARRTEIEAALRSLMPFADERLERQAVPEARWDTDAWLSDPPPGGAWPAEIEPRLSSRPPLFSLERAGVAGLGVEGELLLGWRAGDAIAAELA